MAKEVKACTSMPVAVKAMSPTTSRWLVVAHMSASVLAAECDAWPYLTMDITVCYSIEKKDNTL